VLRIGVLCREVVVVLAPDGPEPPLPPDVAVRFARDARPGEGPLAGVSAGLHAARTHVALVVAGDMPELVTPVLAEMLRVAAEASADAVALLDGERVRPVPCVLRVEAAAPVADALLGSGRRRLRDLIDALHVVTIEERTWCALDPGRRTLLDVDEPGDLGGGARGDLSRS
jgi:molybdopterin-guanine dinucleotide biosynthesis protein A